MCMCSDGWLDPTWHHRHYCDVFAFVLRKHDRIIHLLEELMLEAGATKGSDLRLEVRCIRSGASRDQHGDVVWLDLWAPQSTPSSCCLCDGHKCS
jgi:hypothetical protein